MSQPGRDGERPDPSAPPSAGPPQAERQQRSRPWIRPRSLVALGIGAVVVVGGWWIDRERRHPAAAPARMLRRGDAAARIRAVQDLEGLGRVDPDVALPALVGGLSDPDAKVGAGSALALVTGISAAGENPSAHRAVRGAVDALIRSVEDERAEVRTAAAQALGMAAMMWTGTADVIDRSRILEALKDAAGDRDAGVRVAGLRGIGSVGPQVAEAPPPVLVSALKDDAEPIRAAAAIALIQFRRGLPGIVPDLLRSLESARPEVRPQYREVLGAIHPPHFSPEAIPALVTILGGADPEARALAAWSLATYGGEATVAIPALIRSLDDPRGTRPAGPASWGPSGQELMSLATKSWFDHGISPAAIAPATRDPVVETADALSRLAPRSERPAAAIAALAKLIRTGATPHRVLAAKAMAQFPFFDFSTMPANSLRADPVQIAALTAALDDPEPPARAAALCSLHDIGMKARFAASPELNAAIARALEDPSPPIRIEAAKEVAHHGDVADRFIPALIRHAENDPDKDVRSMCSTVITMESGPRPAEVTPAIVPLLVEALASPDRDLRLSAGRLLGKLAPGTAQGGAALPRLRELSNSPDPGVVEAALKALADIDKSSGNPPGSR